MTCLSYYFHQSNAYKYNINSIVIICLWISNVWKRQGVGKQSEKWHFARTVQVRYETSKMKWLSKVYATGAVASRLVATCMGAPRTGHYPQRRPRARSENFGNRLAKPKSRPTRGTPTVCLWVLSKNKVDESPQKLAFTFPKSNSSTLYTDTMSFHINEKAYFVSLRLSHYHDTTSCDKDNKSLSHESPKNNTNYLKQIT